MAVVEVPFRFASFLFLFLLSFFLSLSLSLWKSSYLLFFPALASSSRHFCRRDSLALPLYSFFTFIHSYVHVYTCVHECYFSFSLSFSLLTTYWYLLHLCARKGPFINLRIHTCQAQPLIYIFSGLLHTPRACVSYIFFFFYFSFACVLYKCACGKKRATSLTIPFFSSIFQNLYFMVAVMPGYDGGRLQMCMILYKEWYLYELKDKCFEYSRVSFSCVPSFRSL